MSGYIGASPLTQAVQKRQSFTATSGQTVFSFSYQPGYLDVFLNGVKMRDTEDYVATNGTSVTFNTGITLGGEVDLVTLSNFTPHDSYFKAESDARYEPIDSAYTKSEADARYLQSVASDSIGADELNVSGNGTAGQYLGSDGDGTMTWTSISSDPTMGGDLSGTASNAQIVANAVGTSEIANSAVTDAKISGMSSSKLSGALPAIDGSALTGMPAGGKVLQLKFGYTNTVTAVGNTSEFDVVSVTITPSSTTSKIYLSGNLFAGTQGGSNNVVWWFRRGGVNIGRFTDSNREGGNSSFEASGGLEEIWNGAGFWLDSPATTSAVTYYLRVTGDDGSGLIINRVGSSSDAVWAKRTYSTITAMEIIV